MKDQIKSALQRYFNQCYPGETLSAIQAQEIERAFYAAVVWFYKALIEEREDEKVMRFLESVMKELTVYKSRLISDL